MNAMFVGSVLPELNSIPHLPKKGEKYKNIKKK
jgi:hypothetical protein